MSDDRLNEARDRISEAWINFGERLRAVCADYTDAELLSIGSEYEQRAADVSNPARDVHAMFAHRVLAALGRRQAVERAEPILAAGGAYCVAHDCDTRECHGKGLHE